jgi:hypothetical protein
MNDTQDEIERLKRQVEQLQKALNDRQQVQTSVANLPTLRDNFEFVSDLARYAEGLCSEQEVRKKYHFDESTWTKLGSDDALAEAIEAEKVRRIRSGAAKRERAQQHIVKGPDILEKIMGDESANARHRIDSVKALNALADNGSGMAPAADRFIIRIDLSADAKLKSTKPDPNDVIVIDATPQKTPAAITEEDDWKR